MKSLIVKSAMILTLISYLADAAELSAAQSGRITTPEYSSDSLIANEAELVLEAWMCDLFYFHPSVLSAIIDELQAEEWMSNMFYFHPSVLSAIIDELQAEEWMTDLFYFHPSVLSAIIDELQAEGWMSDQFYFHYETRPDLEEWMLDGQYFYLSHETIPTVE
jgi:hypothetical protein